MLGRTLDDEDPTNPAHSVNVRVDGLNAALRAFAAHRPVESKATFGTVDSFTLPANCYRIAAIVAVDEDGSAVSLSAATVGNPGEMFGEDSYWVWGTTVHLGKTYVSSTLYYHAYYSVASISTTDIPVPTWAMDAIVYMAAAHCLVPNMTSRARLGAFNDKADASPIQNSLIQASNWYISQFDRIVAAHRQVVGL
jgi:hypothetical protein